MMEYKNNHKYDLKNEVTEYGKAVTALIKSMVYPNEKGLCLIINDIKLRKGEQK